MISSLDLDSFDICNPTIPYICCFSCSSCEIHCLIRFRKRPVLRTCLCLRALVCNSGWSSSPSYEKGQLRGSSGAGASIYMAAVLEYLCAELLELAAMLLGTIRRFESIRVTCSWLSETMRNSTSFWLM
uniref:Histone H2A n=1 Tax=Ditylenchus dipsaci TaxID=166011 RepID=A0A915DZ26_9BILA